MFLLFTLYTNNISVCRIDSEDAYREKVAIKVACA